MGTNLTVIREPDTFTLGSMLRLRRPEGSKTERFFIKQFLMPLGVEPDKRGNLIKCIGDNPTTLWSCHTDTVHRKGGTQVLKYENGMIRLGAGGNSNCLGADDTAGVWLMREMIMAKVPGLYIFHRAEEVGGIGSRHIATKTPKVLSGIRHAIALDRKGTDSVITFQWSGRCCSEDFASELGKRLGGTYKADTTGSFTDTANYMKLVPECTNLSVGYRWEHSSSEELNVVHLLKLRKALIGLKTDDLPVARDPSKHEAKKYTAWGGTYGDGSYYDDGGYRAIHTARGSYGRTSGEDGDRERWRGGNVFCHACSRHKVFCQCPSNSVEIPYDLQETIKRNPDSVVKLLKTYGWGESDIMADLYEHGAALMGEK